MTSANRGGRPSSRNQICPPTDTPVIWSYMSCLFWCQNDGTLSKNDTVVAFVRGKKTSFSILVFSTFCQFLRSGSRSSPGFIYRSDLPLKDVKHVTPPLKRFLFSSKQVLRAGTETKQAVEHSAGCRCTQGWELLFVDTCVCCGVWRRGCWLRGRFPPPQQPCTPLLYSSASSDWLADVHKTTTAHFQAFLRPF